MSFEVTGRDRLFAWVSVIASVLWISWYFDGGSMTLLGAIGMSLASVAAWIFAQRG